LAFQRVA